MEINIGDKVYHQDKIFRVSRIEKDNTFYIEYSRNWELGGEYIGKWILNINDVIPLNSPVAKVLYG